MKAILSAIWKAILALNRSKVVHAVGVFFAVGLPVLATLATDLPAEWKVTIWIGAALGVLSRAQFLWQKVVPLLDGSSVVQVKPPVVGAVPSLLSVAADVGAVPAAPTEPKGRP